MCTGARRGSKLSPSRLWTDAWRLTLAIAVMAGAGCRPAPITSPTDVVTATGTLTYNGRPVAGMQMTFHGTSAEDSAFAVTDGQGRFRCATNDSGIGISPGDYLVTVKSPRNDLPQIYGDPDSTTLSITVEEGATNDFLLEMKDASSE